ncbi:monovalent cation/H+ antiporter subunit D family protein [Corynebacterium poyangense]|uniref:Monovalent cation/H+ antiporter subunit D family protein n=1 Tax=Corynebacterium poyangense TaxID=2684405 RepID=A0A7H0SLL0_9CORY|nr:monovalent cation/H+ antiporter subunit D family protein [Corynebacterium poyangense]QNQ89435.1 monovalent cation/H+ antiporter subunit D family protein [Corynebacterium poyangense]
MGVFLPLFVAIPLISSAIALLLPWRFLRDGIHIIIPLISMVAGGFLFSYTATHGAIAHNVGLYEGGVAIPFAADTFSAIMIISTGLIAVCANWFATIAGETSSRYYASLTLMLVTGVNGALLTADLFNFFVFIEVMLLPSYGLIAMSGTWSRLAGGRTFVLVNLSASTVLVVGVGLLYGVVGTVNIPALAGVGAGHGPAVLALGVVVTAIAAKAGVFPLHTWLPRTYPGTSAAVMGLFSGLHTKVGVYMLFRIYVVIFGLDPRWNWLIITIMVISMLIGGFAGLAENSIRRVLAYQMVNGMPMILVVLAFCTDHPQRALAAGLLYTIHHMVTVGSLVLASGAIEETYGTGLLKKLSGLARRDKLLATIFAAGAFSVVGFPPFSGLWGKVYIVISVVRQESSAAWLVISVIIVASFGALLSMLRVWRKVFWGKAIGADRYPESLSIPGALIAPSGVLILISLAMFFLAGPLINYTLTATDGLLDVGDYQHAVLGDTPVGVPNISELGR